MSNFYCEHCRALCADSPQGYVAGCQHYPPDICSFCGGKLKRARGKGFRVVCTRCGDVQYLGLGSNILVKQPKPISVWTQEEIDEAKREAVRIRELLGWKRGGD